MTDPTLPHPRGAKSRTVAGAAGLSAFLAVGLAGTSLPGRVAEFRIVVEVCALVVLGWWALHRLGRTRGPIELPILVALVALVVVSLASRDVRGSLETVALATAFGLLFLAVVDASRRENLREAIAGGAFWGVTIWLLVIGAGWVTLGEGHSGCGERHSAAADSVRNVPLGEHERSTVPITPGHRLPTMAYVESPEPRRSEGFLARVGSRRPSQHWTFRMARDRDSCSLVPAHPPVGSRRCPLGEVAHDRAPPLLPCCNRRLSPDLRASCRARHGRVGGPIDHLEACIWHLCSGSSHRWRSVHIFLAETRVPPALRAAVWCRTCPQCSGPDAGGWRADSRRCGNPTSRWLCPAGMALAEVPPPIGIDSDMRYWSASPLPHSSTMSRP